MMLFGWEICDYVERAVGNVAVTEFIAYDRYEAAKMDWARAQQDADLYKSALEKIATGVVWKDRYLHQQMTNDEMMEIAKEALNGFITTIYKDEVKK